MVLDDALKKSIKKLNPVGIVFSALGKFVNKLLTKGAIDKGLKSLQDNLGDKIKVYDYPRYTHSKVYIFDEKIAMIGSLNLDDHSLDNNYEIAFSCDDSRFVSQLVQMYNEDLLKTKQTISN